MTRRDWLSICERTKFGSSEISRGFPLNWQSPSARCSAQMSNGAAARPECGRRESLKRVDSGRAASQHPAAGRRLATGRLRWNERMVAVDQVAFPEVLDQGDDPLAELDRLPRERLRQQDHHLVTVQPIGLDWEPCALADRDMVGRRTQEADAWPSLRTGPKPFEVI
jgi:hypothetical protein